MTETQQMVMVAPPLVQLKTGTHVQKMNMDVAHVVAWKLNAGMDTLKSQSNVMMEIVKIMTGVHPFVGSRMVMSVVHPPLTQQARASVRWPSIAVTGLCSKVNSVIMEMNQDAPWNAM